MELILFRLGVRRFTKSPPALLQCALLPVSRLWPVLQIILTIRQNWTDTRTESDRQIQTNTFSPSLVCSLCQSSSGETTLYFQNSSTAGLSLWVCVSTLSRFQLFQYFHSAVAAVNISTHIIQTNRAEILILSWKGTRGEHKLISDKMPYQQSVWTFLCMCRDASLFVPVCINVHCTHQSFDDPKCCALDSGGFSVHVCAQHV